MKLNLKRIGSIFCLVLVLALVGCGSGNNEGIVILGDGHVGGADDVVPDKASLLENLKGAGYTITEYSSVEGSDLTIDRVVAEKGNKYIDMVYGMTEEEAKEIFKIYKEMYDDYYILARNENYVYSVSDKKTFSKAGFTSTSNIGEQYIK